MDLQIIQNKNYPIRNRRVMPDFDLAELYEEETRVLNQAGKRNASRFPEDFMFQLSDKEWETLKSQIVTSSWGGSRKGPFTFTEHGVIMLASVLRSPKAIAVNIAIARAFVALKQMSVHYKALIDKMLLLEDKYDMQFLEIYAALNKLIQENNKQIGWESRERIGFKKQKK